MDQERNETREVESARARIAEDVREMGGDLGEMAEAIELRFGVLFAGAAVGLIVGMLAPLSVFEAHRLRRFARWVWGR